METLLKQINRGREAIKKGPVNSMLMQKPFAEGMYIFAMFIINYYSRVKSKLNIDYDSFIIIQTVVAHKLYQLKKKTKSNSYEELETIWEKILHKYDDPLDIVSDDKIKVKANSKLSFSSICLVTKLPKETVRRKVSRLAKKNILKISKKEGILLGPMYKKIFQDLVPETTLEVSKLLKNWEKTGILKNLLNFKA